MVLEDDVTTDLLRIANRFSVGRLSHATSEMLCSSLCEDNVLEILLAAADVNDDELMRQVTAFLRENTRLLKKPEVIKVVSKLDKKKFKQLLTLFGLGK